MSTTTIASRDAGSEHGTGLWVAAASFVLWGLMPLYWHLLKAVPSLQIVVHRIVWSALLVVGWLAWTQGRRWLRDALARPRVAWMLALSAVLIALQLEPVHLGRERRPRGRDEPGLFHQSAAQRGHRHAVPARTAYEGAVAVGGDRVGGRVVADLQLRQLSVDRAGAGRIVRVVRADPQAGGSGIAARSRRREPVSVPAGAGGVAVVRDRAARAGSSTAGAGSSTSCSWSAAR